MPAYRWICQLCNVANEAERNDCQKCGFPAEATGEELAMARASGSVAVVREARAQKSRERAEWKAQPFWFKAATIVGIAAFVVAIVLARFAQPIEYNLIGLGLLVALFAIFWIGNKLRGPSK
jgi:ABC-type xylose transport system permease subunit